ncbi:DUF1836 domain-containing protein [Evansella cellulosilytica]|uniref:DUF1836 domain-containing protein n=1 Tax=Evansella cellulosilytica (strain ATCC 21833 / DSM 2522 / FERM P-1141 / JCM 9156 / N-4) TaxID=649639 RepID=E6TQT7_EVAC2|nr:DUF1836 domain-containing protein [Evansella cellulosilytica]ADU31712.1 Domain of unknown function DUF1836 [Evansella cellulosilytica DSM 2522]
MKKLNEFVEKAGLEKNILLEDLPNIDLYMDQVIQLFENTFRDAKRNEEEKVLTKTMINNYAKGKLFFPISNKKYSKEHLILISLIYQLKGVLSISDVKKTLAEVNEKSVDGKADLEKLYASYLTLADNNLEKFQESIVTHEEDVQEVVHQFEEQDADYIKQLLTISSLVQMSNMYRRVAEKLVDEINDPDTGKNK